MVTSDSFCVPKEIKSRACPLHLSEINSLVELVFATLFRPGPHTPLVFKGNGVCIAEVCMVK